MLETGHARVTNSLSVMMKNIIDACINVICFWAIGYAFSFGTDVGDGLLGVSNFFLSDSYGVGGFSFFIQWGFSINASTIFGGSVAGRSRFIAYVIISAMVAGFHLPAGGALGMPLFHCLDMAALPASLVPLCIYCCCRCGEGVCCIGSGNMVFLTFLAVALFTCWEAQWA